MDGQFLAWKLLLHQPKMHRRLSYKLCRQLWTAEGPSLAGVTPRSLGSAHCNQGLCTRVPRRTGSTCRHGKPPSAKKKHSSLVLLLFVLLFFSSENQNNNLTAVQAFKKMLKETQFQRIFTRLKTDVANHLRIFCEMRWGGPDVKWLLRLFWTRPARCFCLGGGLPGSLTVWKEAPYASVLPIKGFGWRHPSAAVDPVQSQAVP